MIVSGQQRDLHAACENCENSGDTWRLISTCAAISVTRPLHLNLLCLVYDRFLVADNAECQQTVD